LTIHRLCVIIARSVLLLFDETTSKKHIREAFSMFCGKCGAQLEDGAQFCGLSCKKQSNLLPHLKEKGWGIFLQRKCYL
jgi:4-alpha-glucanotransferase